MNINMDDNSLNFELATSVGEYFQLNKKQMEEIIKEVRSVVRNWKTIATKIGISRNEQELMKPAFRY